MRLLIFIIFIYCSIITLGAKPLSLEVAAEGAILINAKTGAILFQKNAHAPLYPASTTKVATALYALKKKGDLLNDKVVVPKEAIVSITPEAKKQSNYRSPAHWLESDGGHVGMKRGEVWHFKDVLAAMLIASANDAANVVASHVGGTIVQFMEGLNTYLKEIGCKKTHFLNPHGLHHPDQTSTPYDMALIAQEAMKLSTFRELVALTRYTCPRTNLEEPRNIIQTNLLLRRGKHYYPKAIGIKTGTTMAAGKALVAGAVDGERTLIAVVMGCQKNGDRYEDVTKMFEAAFKEPLMRRYLLPKGAQKLTKKVMGAKNEIKTYLPEGLYYDFYPSEEVAVKASVKWLNPVLPIEKGQCVGVVRVLNEKRMVLQELPLLAAEKVSATAFYRLKMGLTTGKWVGKVVFGVFVVSVFLVLRTARRRVRN